MKKIIGLVCLFLVAGYALNSLRPAPNSETINPSIIPKPQNVTHLKGGLFSVDEKWSVSGTPKTAQAFVALMKKTAKWDLAYQGEKALNKQSIHFEIADIIQGAEGYQISATTDGIRVIAETETGLFYGATSVWQMLVPSQGKTALLSPVKITDKPRFGWRGLMLDEARHFQGEAFVKNLIDWMSLHKFNIFQWHLVDDQGWRIEIKKYPNLTKHGAWRVPAGDGPVADIDPATGKPRKIGGFYTQEQIKDIVAYAKARHITIVPEIGLPGHAQSAVATYPQFGVKATAGPVSSDWGIFPITYNLEEKTFQYLEDVLLEVMDLFPSEYIHLGGDEVQKGQWKADPRTQARMKELGIESVEGIQPYFTRHFDKFLSKHNRKMIGWDEVLEGGEINKTTTVMSWRGEKGGIEAAHKGHEVIMSPWPVMYLDMHQSTSGREPTGRPARSSLGPLKNIYNYEPVPKELAKKGHEYIKGAQGNIWTEHMRTNDHVMHMTFPRAAAIAEVVWSSPEKNFDDFMLRLPSQIARYDSLGINYADVAYEVQIAVAKTGDKSRLVTLSNQVGTGTIHYTLDGSTVTHQSPVYLQQFVVTDAMTVKASTFVGRQKLSAVSVQKMDKVSLSVRTDDTLEVCEPGYHLKLDDDMPSSNKRAAFAMNILNPCWIYRGADLGGVSTLEFEVGQIPFNFQIGDDWKKVSFDTPKSKDGELNIYKGTCTGSPVVSIPLAPIISNHELSQLSVDVPKGLGKVSDLCFRFARPAFTNQGIGHNLWGVNKVTLR